MALVETASGFYARLARLISRPLEAHRHNLIVSQTANFLTAIRAGMVPFGLVWLYPAMLHQQNNRLACILGFWLFALTDAVDGPVAKQLQQESWFGRLADPFVDKLMTATVMLIWLKLVWHFFSGPIVVLTTLVVIIRLTLDVCLLAFEAYGAVRHRVPGANHFGKIKFHADVLATSLGFLGLIFASQATQAAIAYLVTMGILIAIWYAIQSLLARVRLALSL